MSFAPTRRHAYIARMLATLPSSRFLARAALVSAVTGALTGAAFAAWLENGPAMLTTFAASGLNWCF